MLHRLELIGSRYNQHSDERPVAVDRLEAIQPDLKFTFINLVGQTLTKIARNPEFAQLDPEEITTAAFHGITEFLRFMQPEMSERLNTLILEMRTGSVTYSENDLAIPQEEPDQLHAITLHVFNILIRNFYHKVYTYANHTMLRRVPSLELTTRIQSDLQAVFSQFSAEAVYIHVESYRSQQFFATVARSLPTQ